MISLACTHCGMKLQVREELAGRRGPCPTCKQILTVPSPAPPTIVPTGQINGAPSSLNQAGLDVGVTLDPPSGSFSSEEHRAVADLLAGRTRTGSRYVVEKEIARGGMGAVVRAVDCDIRREVAVKYMLRDGDTAQKARFVEEAQITGQLEHPNIVPIHELGVDAERRLFFAMKMVKGRSLAQVLDDLRKEPVVAERTWSLGRLLNIFTNVCYALAYAHSRGVIHRDLKPANIMLGDFGETYVMDWGLAKVVEKREPKNDAMPSAAAHPEFSIRTTPSAAAASTILADGSGSGSGSSARKVATSRELEGELTEDGAILGTPSYMSPEQARGEVYGLDHRSDIYSLGAILYEMLTLVTPVEKDGGSMAILMRVAEGRITPPEQRTPARAKAGKIPKELSAVALKALALKPAARYQSVEALRQDIERFQEGRAVSAKHDTPLETAVKFVRRNKAFSAATAVGLVVLSTVLAVAFNVNYRARLRAEQAQTTAEQHFVAFEHEQQAKNNAIRKSIPGTLRAARQLANDGASEEALAQIALVRTYEPNNVQAALLAGLISIGVREWPVAVSELNRYLHRHGDDAEILKLRNTIALNKIEDGPTLLAAAESLQRQRLFGLAKPLLTELGKQRELRKPLHALYERQIKAVWPDATFKLELDGQFTLYFPGANRPTSLDPLRGIPIDRLSLDRSPQITNLEPLRGMKLTYFRLNDAQIVDLEPLRDMPLSAVDLIGCRKVSDLGPLRGMQLTSLALEYCRVTNLEPLRGMPLKYLNLKSTAIQDVGPLTGMPLESFYISNSALVEDLRPLHGLPLQTLELNQCRRVKDLEPLRGMPLERLDIAYTAVEDLSPLEGLPLRSVTFRLRDIRRGAEALNRLPKLQSIDCGYNGKETPEEFWKRFDAGEYQLKK